MGISTDTINKEINIQPSIKEQDNRKRLIQMFLERPIPDDQILDHLEVFMRPQRFYEILALYELYEKILETPGSVMEFGVRWGRHLSMFNAFRAYLEPYNFYRKIVGFDTFEGFLDPSEEDGKSSRVHKGAMAVSAGYDRYLDNILMLHEAETPLSHIKKCELRKGDAPQALKAYFDDFPETIVALAYFDMDVYKPTKECLEILKPHLTKGSIIAFDELLHPQFPGESLALKEVFNISECKLQKIKGSPYPTFFCLE